jgi:hypothetical protein
MGGQGGGGGDNAADQGLLIVRGSVGGAMQGKGGAPSTANVVGGTSGRGWPTTWAMAAQIRSNCGRSPAAAFMSCATV